MNVTQFTMLTPPTEAEAEAALNHLFSPKEQPKQKFRPLLISFRVTYRAKAKDNNLTILVIQLVMGKCFNA
jgi:hypothetical protein